MQVGSANQVLNFLINFNYNHETQVVLSTNSGNCSVQNRFDATAGGVTLGTAATYTPSNTYYTYLMTLLGTS